MNLEAESLIDRIIWRRLVPGAFLIVLAAVALVYLLR